jgi:hypothetical protein
MEVRIEALWGPMLIRKSWVEENSSIAERRAEGLEQMVGREGWVRM